MGDITDQMTVNNIISKVRPSIIYNMAGQTFVYHSFNASAYTFQVNSIGVINILESVRSMNRISETKIFQVNHELYRLLQVKCMDRLKKGQSSTN